MFIDAHSHQRSKPNLNIAQVLVGVDTLAIHPWELTLPFSREKFDKEWDKILQKEMDIVAIGECGLDRAHENIASIEDQKYVLLKHFQLAKEKNLPIILHTVRSYSDLLEILKKVKFTQSILLHAFGGREHEMHELMKYPVYFSYGARLFNTDKMLKITPMERLLLETGDQDQYTIVDIYQKASESLEVKVSELEVQLKKNFLAFFSKQDDVSAADFIQNLHRRKLTGL